ncbi:MAG: hypothetical protein KJ954_01850 [Alphaproteobacteria bacterium]|nr:hypothetical protein [Alphaproteobacteria bacterium]MBU2116320.1 hypothetical protein [Alphaproteobacteria bacterium]
MPYVLIALSVWLAWQIVISLVVQRGPPEAAVRLAPGSAQALSRAAEAELVAERHDQAADLAVLALRRAPFDVRSLRVFGLVRARTDEAAADEILTLAGNWSLRDDPSHAWLMNRRLQRGDYVGAFGHADTLVRRRVDLREPVFRLFSTAAALDPRALPALINRMDAQPNWRTDYLNSLVDLPEGPAIQAALALGLNDRAARLTDGELQTIYMAWVRAGRIAGLRVLRERLSRPAPARLHDGDFEGPDAPIPFGWIKGGGVGIAVEVSEDPTRDGQHALYVQSDGFSVADAATQLLLLDPGVYSFSGEVRFDAGGDDARLAWVLSCLETGRPLVEWSPAADAANPEWSGWRTTFEVPASGCSAQWLRLKSRRGDRRSSVSAWFDRLRVDPAGGPRRSD